MDRSIQSLYYGPHWLGGSSESQSRQSDIFNNCFLQLSFRSNTTFGQIYRQVQVTFKEYGWNVHLEGRWTSYIQMQSRRTRGDRLWGRHWWSVQNTKLARWWTRIPGIVKFLPDAPFPLLLSLPVHSKPITLLPLLFFPFFLRPLLHHCAFPTLAPSPSLLTSAFFPYPPFPHVLPFISPFLLFCILFTPFCQCFCHFFFFLASSSSPSFL